MGILSRKRRLIGVALTVLVLGVVGLVYAAWTTNGSGSGYAKAESSQALTTTDVSASTTASLYPGADGDLKIQIDNSNDYPVRVRAVNNGTGSITPDGAHSGCNASSVAYTNTSGLTVDIPAHGSTTSTLSGKVHMNGTADDACQGATFTIPVDLVGASNVTP
jgi:hypothetical protein